LKTFFHNIKEENKLALNKPPATDVVYYSELKEWYTENAFRSFSLKFVLDRRIYYRVGRQEHLVPAGSFLLACQQPGVKAYFDSREMTRSVCIDICPETVSEAYAVLTTEQANMDNFLDHYFKPPEFFETVSPAPGSAFDNKLSELATAIRQRCGNQLVDREWFLDLAEKIILHEYGHYRSLRAIPSVKAETRKEILRRLKLGREYMNDRLLLIEEISEVATACMMSEFHFYRSFKQAFGISPYQYLLNARLDCARALIEKGDVTITEVAAHCHFPDIYTFSKAFKKKFGIPPSRFIATV
jgi:AraC-like DNA-binding protein